MTNTNAEHPAPETAPEFVERLKRPTRPDDSCKAVIDELQATSAFLCDSAISLISLSSRRPVASTRLEGGLSGEFCAILPESAVV